jgi:hypothetical protein
MSWLQITGLLATMMLGRLLGAQESTTTTLHVYTNLIQIPVLVLNPDWGRHAPVPEDHFRIAVDGGTLIPPKHVRREGDDAIDLSILMDAADQNDALLPRVGKALRQIAPGLLQAHDRVSIYAMDCELLRSRLTGPPDGAKLEQQVDAALNHWKTYRSEHHERNCRQDVPLMDALMVATDDASRMPGRHVILAITNGKDHGSRRQWSEVKTFAQATGVAVFGMEYKPEREKNTRSAEIPEDRFNLVCQLTGGMVMSAGEDSLRTQLERFITTLRERYIVEFPRSNHVTAGAHSILVSVGDPLAIVRPAGIAVPLADPNLLADPTTVPSDNTLAPEPGQRKILPVPK